MGNKVSTGEVHQLEDSINSSLKSLHSETEKLRTNINKLSDNSDFKGKTAENINRYNTNFHIETIKRLDNVKKEYASTFKKSINAFHDDVDSSEEAIIVSDELKNYKDDLIKPANAIENTKVRMNSTVLNVADITTAESIKGNEVKDKLKDVTKHIDDTIDKLEDYVSAHTFDNMTLEEMITPIKTMTSKVSKMSPDRSKITSVGRNLATDYKMADKDNPIKQFSEQLEDYRSYLYGGKKYKDVVKSLLELKNACLASYIVGDGSIRKGNKILSSAKSIDKLGKKRTRLLNSILKTNLENIEGKKVFKAVKFMFEDKPNMKMSEKFKSALKMTRNYNDKEFKKIYETAKPKKSIKKAWVDKYNELKNKVSFKNLKKKFNVKNLKDLSLKKWKDFKGSNLLGKSSKLMKVGSKALAPVGTVMAIGNNFLSKKSLQRKIVDTSVDLGAMGASSATGFMVGAAIGGPVGAAVGGVVGALTGVLLDKKINGKSVTDIAKEKANNAVNNFKHKAVETTHKVAHTLNKTKEKVSNAAHAFGHTLSKVF